MNSFSLLPFLLNFYIFYDFFQIVSTHEVVQAVLNSSDSEDGVEHTEPAGKG
jgi:hypothetical protein